MCPGCIGRGGGSHCYMCDQPIPAGLQRPDGQPAYEGDAYDPSCPSCARHHPHPQDRGMMKTGDEERRVLPCGCRIDVRDGRLLGFARVCSTAGSLFKEEMAAVTEEAEVAVQAKLRRHAMTGRRTR